MPNGSYWGGMTDSENYGSFVRANNKYDAAVYSLGLSVPESVPVEVRSKLSDPNHGGRFYEYAQTFYNVQGWPNMPEWLPAYAMASVGLGASFDRIFASNASVNLRTGAEIDFRVIVGGGDVGGGGGSGGSGYVSYDCGINPVTVDNPSQWHDYTATNATFSNGVVHATGGTTKYTRFIGRSAYKTNYRVYVPSSVDSQIRALAAGHDLIYIFDPDKFQYVIGDNLRFEYKQVDTYQHIKMYVIYGDNMHLQSFQTSAYYDGSVVFCVCPSGVVVSLGSSANSVGPFSYSDIFAISPGPDGDWPVPETPVTPTAPELPEPVTPTFTPEPTVTEPTPTWPVIPTPTAPTVTLTETPEGLDYTQLLTLINDNLNDINSYTVAINSNFNSLRSDLVTEFDSVVQALRNIYQYLQHLDNLLERHCVHLQNKMEDVSVDIQNKMRELVHWLADQLDFDSESSGNSDLFGILSTINDKLGGGTYEPNPIRDEQGYYDWLDDLWDRFLLGDDWESSVSGISSSFGQLKTRFPFSVPWDIVALFRLFVHEPVTPEFDLPLYFSSDSSTPVHVDLSAWDDVASIVRPLVYVIFALKLALLSRDLLGGLGADKGGL